MIRVRISSVAGVARFPRFYILAPRVLCLGRVTCSPVAATDVTRSYMSSRMGLLKVGHTE